MELIRANGAPAQRRHSMQIEVNRALYMDERTRLPNDGYAPLQATFSDLARHIADFAQTRLEPCTT
jgi:N-formylglutamate deformylase